MSDIRSRNVDNDGSKGTARQRRKADAATPTVCGPLTIEDAINAARGAPWRAGNRNWEDRLDEPGDG